MEAGRLVVYLCGRNADGSRGKYALHGTRPHFYVPTEELDAFEGSDLVVEVERDSARTLYGETVSKITTRYPFDVPRVRDKFERHFEADVIYENRIRFDHGIRNVITFPEREVLQPEDIQPAVNPPEIKPRIFVLDIETMDNTGRRPKPKNPQAEVVSIAVWDSFSGQYIVIVNGEVDDRASARAAAFFLEKTWAVKILPVLNEAALFEAFKGFVETFQPDILAGWFSNGFDFPYLQNRAEQQSYASIRWSDFALFDAMMAHKRRHEGVTKSDKLDDVAKELGIGAKIQRPPIYELYRSDRGTLIAYNANDVYLCKEIMAVEELTEFFLTVAGISGCGLQDLWHADNKDRWKFSTGTVVDAYVFHWLHEHGGIVQPTKKKHEKDEEIEGADVFESDYGIYRNVVEFDNSGEYANIIRSFNLSPETKRAGCSCGGSECFVLPSGHHYAKEPHGVFPSIIDELLIIRQRKKTEGREQEYRVVKELVNSFYGSLASPYYRNFDPEIAGDITEVARLHLAWNRAFFEAKGYKVIAGDTDSCHVLFEQQTHEEVGTLAPKLLAELNATFPALTAPWGAPTNELSVKVEHHYDTMMLLGIQKKYVGVYRDPKGLIERNGMRYSLKVRGLETRRANAAEITKRLQFVIFEEGIFGLPVRDKLMTMIQEARKEPTLFGIPQSIGKDADEYKTLPQHFKAAQWSNENLGRDYIAGDKPCLYFGFIRGKSPTEVFCLDFEEPLPEGAVVDWDSTLERVVVKPLRRLLKVVGLEADEILSPTQEAEAFFG